MSTSVAYLRKRLTDIGRHDLLEAAEAGLVSFFAAAEEAGLINHRRPVLGTGSPNQAKKRAWTLARITRQAPPLASKPAAAKFSQETPRNGRSAPTTPIDLAAVIAEWEEAQKPPSPCESRQKGDDVTLKPRDPAPAVLPELVPFPTHPAVPCTSCSHPQAAAALREVLDVYVAACRGEPHRTGSVLPRACCQWLRRPDVRAMIA
jgi:hypothetical protein